MPLVAESEDESTSLMKSFDDPVSEMLALREEKGALEERVRMLERDLRVEREERRRREAEASIEHDRESSESERRWMEQVRALREERDRLQGELLILEESMDGVAAEVNRAVASRYEVEHRNESLQIKLDDLVKDYEDTMQERSTVLEENNRLSEDRDKLRSSVKQLSAALHNRQSEETAQIHALNAKLENARRMLNEATRRSKNFEELKELQDRLAYSEREREEALRLLSETRAASPGPGNEDGGGGAAIVDHWSTHAFSVALQIKGNLGIVLEGGSSEGSRRHLPIYVKEILTGSPLESFLRRLDHIVMVNDIDVSEMDVRSVVDILRNSHNLKMVVRRRTSLHRVVQLPMKSEAGLELSTGVFVNRLEKGGSADRAGIRLGNRLIYVNAVPVYDAKHAEELLRKEASLSNNGTVTLCFLNGAQRNTSLAGLSSSSTGGGSIGKQKTLLSKVHEKLFRRNGSASSASSSSTSAATQSDKSSHVVVARANIDEGSSRGPDMFVRHGSLRLPTVTPPHGHTSQFMRTGSLRAPQGSHDRTKIIESLDRYLQGHSSFSRASPLTAPASDAGTWPKSLDTTSSAAPPDHLVRRRGIVRPSVFPVFSAPPPPPIENLRDRRCSCSSPTGWAPGTSGSSNAVDVRASYTPSPVPSSLAGHRMSTYSPALPQPPPYPGPRYGDDSMSSIVSSTNSVPQHSVNSTLNRSSRAQPNNSPTESEAEVRRVCLSKADSQFASEFGIDLENGADGGVYIAHVHGTRTRTNDGVQRGDRVLDIGGINMRSADKAAATRVLNQFHASQDEVTMTVSARNSGCGLPAFWATIPRSELKLCGGNAVGILTESSVGDLLSGDRILELDGFDARRATLEEALTALATGRADTVDVLAERGSDGLERLRSGDDGDAFYVRMNADRIGETNDELDVKQGEIVYVDNTVFMGQRGRWRAWRVDREGRQRQCGIIPSGAAVEMAEARSRRAATTKQTGVPRPPSVINRPIYERVERVSSANKRPVLLIGAVIAPFIQALLDDPGNKFAPCVAECRAIGLADLERLLHSGLLVDARRRDKLYDVISAGAVQHVIDNGLHCILDVSPSAIPRLHALRIYPIVIKIKFKSAKQIKELKEDLGEKITTKASKELLERSLVIEGQLEGADCVVSTVPVGTQTPAKVLVKHVCQQVIAHVEHEQKKMVWVAAKE